MASEPQEIRSRWNGFVDGNQLDNQLLLTLPNEECRIIFPRLVFLPLRSRDALNETGEPIKYGYFMNSGLASIVNVMEDGRSVEVGLAGQEGFVGVPLLVGFESSPNRVIMLIEGSGFRIGAPALVQLLQVCPVLKNRLERYVQIVGLQSAQVAACNRLHQVEHRLARWLLMAQDRIHSDRIPLTQEFLGELLGTHRSSVTVAAGILQTGGSIAYTPGHVTILSRAGLEKAACECYAAVVQQASRWHKEAGWP